MEKITFKKIIVLLFLMFISWYCFSETAKKSNEKKYDLQKAEKINDVEIAEKRT